MQEHSFSIVVDAPPEEVWEVFWYRGDDRPRNKIGTIDILHPGDEVGNGLVRHCTFPVPRLVYRSFARASSTCSAMLPSG